MAPRIPAAVRSQTVFAALVAWTGAVLWGTISGVRLAGRALGRDYPTAATVLALGGIAVAAVAATQLQIIRLLYDRPALTWNIDWRFHLNHAQAIARYGSVDRALDYAGVPVSYHVGPAWLAGATERVLGHGIYGVSFGLVPLLCVLSTAIAALYTMRVHGIPYRLAAAASGIAMTLPGLRNTPRGLYYGLLDGPDVMSELWSFSSMLMLNSYLGVAVGLACAALLLDRRSRGWQIALASVGLASLVQLKPQFFVGVGLFVGLLGIERALGHHPGARADRVLWAGAGALALGLTFAIALPASHYASAFAAPAWAPGRTGYALTEPLANATLLFLVAVAVWSTVGASKRGKVLMGIATATYIGLAAFPDSRSVVLLLLVALAGSYMVIVRDRPHPRGGNLSYWLLVRVAAALSIIVAVLHLVSFPVRADVVAQAQRLVDPGFAAGHEQGDLAQAAVPLRLLLVTSALGLLALSAAQGGTWWRRGFAMAGVLGVLSPLPLIGFAFAHPLRGYETAEDASLLQTLREVPRNDQLLIASDLADPAENHRRPLRAFLLTGYTGHAFYAANLRYVHYTRGDAVERLDELRAFFGSPWSGWHDAWLHRRGVGYVLVNERCRPVWLDHPGVPLNLLAQHGPWMAYDTPGGSTPAFTAPMPVAREVTPRFGAQGCLAFRSGEGVR